MTTGHAQKQVLATITDRYQYAHVEREGAYLVNFCTCRTDPANGQRIFTGNYPFSVEGRSPGRARPIVRSDLSGPATKIDGGSR